MINRSILSLTRQTLLAVALAMVVIGCAQSPPPDGLVPPPLSNQAEEATSTLSMPGQELWIVTADDGTAAAAVPWPMFDDHRLGAGTLTCKSRDTIEPQHTDVKVQITGFLAVSTVSQTFVNSGSAAIDAYYRFSLPRDSAINDFTITIGERHIRGIVRPKKDAERIYQSAKNSREAARLLGEDGPGAFYTQLGNLDPGKSLDIQIVCAQTLQYRGGWLNYQYFASGPTSITAHIEAGADIDSIKADADGMIVRKPTTHSADVELPAQFPKQDWLPLAISYRLAGGGPHAMYVTQADPSGGGYAALMVMGDGALTRRSPMWLDLLVDNSNDNELKTTGSVAKALIAKLDEHDQLRLDFTSRKPGHDAPPALRQARPDVRAAAMDEIDKETSAASGPPSLAEHLRFPYPGDLIPFKDSPYISWLVVVSSGRNVDLPAAARIVRDDLSVRLAVIPTAMESSLESVARCAGGIVGGGGLTSIDRLFAAMSQPTLFQMSVDWKSAQVEDVFPARNLDVYPQRPLVLMAHCKSAPPAAIVLNGYSAGKPVSIPVTAIAAADSPGIDRLWARRKMADLVGRYIASGDDDVLKQITQVAMDHGMISPFTSILLVDAVHRAPAP